MPMQGQWPNLGSMPTSMPMPFESVRPAGLDPENFRSPPVSEGGFLQDVDAAGGAEADDVGQADLYERTLWAALAWLDAVDGSRTHVSFIFPPLEMLVRRVPGEATRLKQPGTISTTSGSVGSGERAITR